MFLSTVNFHYQNTIHNKNNILTIIKEHPTQYSMEHIHIYLINLKDTYFLKMPDYDNIYQHKVA